MSCGKFHFNPIKENANLAEYITINNIGNLVSRKLKVNYYHLKAVVV